MGTLLRLSTIHPKYRFRMSYGRSDSEPRGDRDLLPIAIVLWIVCAVRVTIALLHAEVFGPDATLATAFVIGLPWLFLGRKAG